LANTDTLKGVEVEVTEFQIGDSLVKEGTINLPDMGIGCYIGGTVRGRSRICSEKAMAKR